MAEDVTRWLEALGLGKYADSFAQNDIDFSLLTRLSAHDLKELGLSVGHRRRFLDAVANLTEPPLMEPGPSITSALRHDAERRQLTVMFCDLVDFTELSQQLDPEDLREIIREYQDAAKSAIERYGGFVARYMGDGILAYFGYPQAHEDDAERAIHAGLAAVAAMGELNATTGKDQGVELSVRVGIATGPVVVGDLIGKGASLESAVVGETPNLAARLQTTADRNTVVIGPSTRRLVEGLFDCDDLGPHHLKGISRPITAYRVRAESGVPSRFEAQAARGLTPLVGRSGEIGLLRKRWEQSKDGEGQIVLLCAEAGIGKSRIVRGFRERLEGEPHDCVLYYGSPYHCNSAFHPVIDQLQRALRFQQDDSATQKLDKLDGLLVSLDLSAPQYRPVFARLLSLTAYERNPTLKITPEEIKRKTLEALIRLIQATSTHRPLLVVVEDAHWLDPSTIEFLGLLIQRIRSSRVFLLITARPELKSPWRTWGQISTITLSGLGRKESATMIADLTRGKALPKPVLDEIVDSTDGVPLFIEELTKTVLESELVTEREGAYELTEALAPLTIPTSLHDSLMARLDSLGPAKEVAQIAAVLGREFAYENLEVVSAIPKKTLQGAMSRLMDAGLILDEPTSSGAIYKFKHALVRDAAYESLLKSKRRKLHAHTAIALENKLIEGADIAPELIAHHYTAARNHERAIEYWETAGQHARAQAASLEAISHFSAALNLLRSQPHSVERAHREVVLQIEMAGSMFNLERIEEELRILKQAEATAARHGFNLERSKIHHERGSCYYVLGNNEDCMKQHKLSVRYARQAGAPEQEVRALGGLGDAFYVRGRVMTAHAQFDQCIEISRRNEFPPKQIYYFLFMRGVTSFYRNSLRNAFEDLQTSVKVAEEIADRRTAAVATQCAGYVLCERGEIGEAAQWFEAGLNLARQWETRRQEPVSLMFLAEISSREGRWLEARELAEQAVAICRETGMDYLGPRALAKLALCTTDREVAERALNEGEKLLEGEGGIVHNYLWYYRDALDVGLRNKAWDRVDRYVAALEEYTHAEPLPWTNFYIARGRVLAAFGRGDRSDNIMRELQGLRDEAKRVGLIAATLALEEAFSLV